MNLFAIFQAVRSRWGAALFFAMLTLFSTIFFTYQRVPKWFASTELLIKTEAIDVVSGDAAQQRLTRMAFLKGEVDILSSTRVASEAVGLLGRDKDPWNVQAWRQAAPQEDIRDWLAADLLKWMSFTVGDDGTRIQLVAQSDSALESVKMANAVTDAYLAVKRGLLEESNSSYRTAFASEEEALLEAFRDAQQRFTKAQQEMGASNELLAALRRQLSQLSSQAQLAENELVRANATVASMRQTGPDALPEIVSDPVVVSLRQRLSLLSARSADLSARLGEQHPQRMANEATMQAVRQQLDSAVGQAEEVVLSQQVVAQRQFEELSRKIEALKLRVRELETQVVQLGFYETEVANAQAALESATSRGIVSATSDAGMKRPVSILRTASVDSAWSVPDWTLNLWAGSVGALLLAFAGAAMIESIYKPVRSADDLRELVGVPVLAVIGPADSKRAIRALTGTTVLLGRPRGEPTLQMIE